MDLLVSGWVIAAKAPAGTLPEIDYEKVQDSIREIFLRKGEAIVEINLKALAAGKEIAEKLMQ